MVIILFHPTLDIGGAPINNIMLADNLQKKGHKVVVVADDGALRTDLRERGIAYRRVEARRYGHVSFGLVQHIARAVREEKAEVIWVSDYLPCLNAYLAGWITNTPVFPLHGSPQVPPFYLPKEGKCGWVNPHHRDHVIKKCGWDERNVYLIRGRMEVDKYRPRRAKRNVLPIFGVGEREAVVMLIGNIIKEKAGSIELFLAAAERLGSKRGDVRFIVIGGGVGQYQAQLERCRESSEEINRRCGREAVILTGPLTPIAEVMREADIVAGMASTCILSLLSGRPTVVLGNGKFSEVVTPDTFKELAYNHFNMHEKSRKSQPARLCGQIESLLKDGAWREELGRWGRSKAVRIFDVNVGACQFEQALQDAILDHKGNGRWSTGRLLKILRCWFSAGWYKLRKEVIGLGGTYMGRPARRTLRKEVSGVS